MVLSAFAKSKNVRVAFIIGDPRSNKKWLRNGILPQFYSSNEISWLVSEKDLSGSVRFGYVGSVANVFYISTEILYYIHTSLGQRKLHNNNSDVVGFSSEKERKGGFIIRECAINKKSVFEKCTLAWVLNSVLFKFFTALSTAWKYVVEDSVRNKYI